jgi:hypothetical protein
MEQRLVYAKVILKPTDTSTKRLWKEIITTLDTPELNFLSGNGYDTHIVFIVYTTRARLEQWARNHDAELTDWDILAVLHMENAKGYIGGMGGRWMQWETQIDRKALPRPYRLPTSSTLVEVLCPSRLAREYADLMKNVRGVTISIDYQK